MLFGKSAKLRVAAISILITGLAACAAAPPANLTDSVASRIRTIAMLDIAEPAIELVLNRGSGNESRSSTYAQALTDQQTEFSPLLTEAITRQLERSNYQVSILANRRPVIAADGSIDLSAVQTDADAILVVRFIRAGYVSASTEALQPWVVVDVQLFDSRSRQKLYSKTFDGGYNAGAAGLIHLATQPRFRFASAQQLTDKLEDSVSGIKDAELAIASAVGQDFAIGSRPVASDIAQSAIAESPQTTTAERDQQVAAALAAQWAPVPAPAAAAAADATTAGARDNIAAAPVATEPAATLADVEDGVGADISSPEAALTSDAPLTRSPAREPGQAVAAPGIADETPAQTPLVETVQQAQATPDAIAAPVEPMPAAALPVVSSSEPAVPVPDPGAPPSATETATPATGGPRSDAATTPKLTITSTLRGGGPTVILQQSTPLRVSPTARSAIVAVLPAGAGGTRDARIIRNAAGSWCYIESGTIAGWVPLAAIGR